MSVERQELKFRVDAATFQRLKWIVYCVPELTQQDALVDALGQWLDQKERQFGPPAQPKSAAPSPQDPPKKLKITTYGTKKKKDDDDDDDIAPTAHRVGGKSGM